MAFVLACLPAAGLAAGPTVGDCPVFPADNVWNTRIDALAVDPKSAAYVQSIGADASLKADFGAALYEHDPIGIPFIVVPANQPTVPIAFAGSGDEPAVADESDPGPYPIPPDALIEGGLLGSGERHVLVVQEERCTLYELYKAAPNADGGWNAVSSAAYDLGSNALRPDGWTSADAAGLPIFPGLVRYEEVAAGAINHALRFTAPRTQRAYVWPARHFASQADDPALPPMGMRFRLKASVDITGFAPANQVILQALKTYGMILADNGSPWFLSGVPNDSWNDDELHELRQLKGGDFEAVDVLPLMNEADSAQARAP